MEKRLNAVGFQRDIIDQKIAETSPCRSNVNRWIISLRRWLWPVYSSAGTVASSS